MAIYAHVVYVRSDDIIVTRSFVQISSANVADTERRVRASVSKADKQLRTHR